MKFAYEAFDAAGKAVASTVEAADADAAGEALRRQGLFVTEIGDAKSGGALARSKKRRRLSTGKRLKNLAVFFRQLSVLVASGTPQVQALAALERQAKEPAWRDVLAGVRIKVEEGATLSEAMEAHPEAFDPVSRSLVAAGESGGGFDEMLDRIAVLAKKSLHVRSAVVGAMVYPCLLIFIAIAVLNLMLLFVLPRFTVLFTSLDVPLPASTKFLMTLSDLLRNYWWVLIGGLVGGFFGIRSWVKSDHGKRTLDTVVLRLPMFGKTIKSFSIARITRVLGVLVNGKVPLLDALALARQTAKNVHYIKLVEDAEEAVTRGSTISSVFAESTLVDPSLVEAVRSGEQSGQIGMLLLNISDFLDEENEVVIKSLTSILEPIILMVLGVVVGFIAISMFLPLFDLTSMAQGGGH